jgi:lysophospholipase L1-like esterase
VLALAGACSGGGLAAGPARSSDKGERYVAVGASETVGFGLDNPLTEAWPQLVFRGALPRGTVFTNVGISGATVERALKDEVPQAVALKPTVVTVWLNVNDILHLVQPPTYEAQLRDLLHQLRAGGTTKVFVANTPALDHLPAYLACRPNPPVSGPRCTFGLTLPDPSVINGAVDAYNAAVDRDARAEGAVVVDLHAASLSARDKGVEATLIGPDGFHPNAAGHEAVAAAFTDAIKRAL